MFLIYYALYKSSSWAENALPLIIAFQLIYIILGWGFLFRLFL